MSSLDLVSLAQAALECRGLAMDAVAKAKSGHLGLPLGCAEIGAVLFGDSLRYNPADPKWLNRDRWLDMSISVFTKSSLCRFVLSAGHGSMFLYGWLHVSGFDVTIDDIRNFRALGSRTPGMPFCQKDILGEVNGLRTVCSLTADETRKISGLVR